VLCWRRFHPFNLEARISDSFLDKFKLQTKSLRSPGVSKLGSEEEQLASNVGSQSILAILNMPVTKK
jgi:hypothetical protein